MQDIFICSSCDTLITAAMLSLTKNLRISVCLEKAGSQDERNLICT